MKKNPAIVRPGDRVRIIDARIVVRVGYPKTPADYLPEAERLFLPGLRGLLDEYQALSPGDKLRNRLMREMTYVLAHKDGFGGAERSLHMTSTPELLGEDFEVFKVRNAYTGLWYPPSGGGRDEWNGDYYDVDPGGLDDRKCHRLLTLDASHKGKPVVVPLTHVEKVMP